MSRNGTLGRPHPWRLGDLLGLYASLAAGAIVILLAWWGASGTPNVATQVVWANVGAGGLVVAGVGSAIWILTGRRAIGERMEALLGDRARRDVIAQAAPAAIPSTVFVSGPRMTLYHRKGCPLASGKDVHPASAAEQRRAGRRPCGVCMP